MPIRPFRDADGNVHINRSWPVNRYSTGPELDSLEHRCDVMYTSHFDRDPANYRMKEWFQAFYTEDGTTVHAIVHNEHNSYDLGDAQYTEFQNMTYAISTDGGATFTQPEPPGNLVAAVPHRYRQGVGYYGLIGGSNIVRGDDGAYYMLVIHTVHDRAEQRICVLRSEDLADPGSWRAWDGDGFDMRMVDPYRDEGFDPEAHECPLPDPDLETLGESFVYNTYLDRYVAVALGVSFPSGRITWGITYSTSDDLVGWTTKKPLLEGTLGAHAGPGGVDALAYAVVVDPDSPSRNFDTAGKTAYVYYTRQNHFSGVAFHDNDLVRFPIEFFGSEQEARAADVRTRLSLTTDVSGSSGVLSGTLTDLGGDPIPGVEIEFTSHLDDAVGEVYEYTVTETVPDRATGAFAGFRVNTECNCAGANEFFVHEFEYSEEGGPNQVRNPTFGSGLSRYNTWGDGSLVVEPSDAGGGSMLHVAATADQHIGLFSDQFAVTPGATFTYTVRSRVVPGTFGSGFFGLFFSSNESGEAMRVTIPFHSVETPVGTTTTDASGDFEFAWEREPADPVVVTATFPGNTTYWGASSSSRVG
jgi:hypothetical protein